MTDKNEYRVKVNIELECYELILYENKESEDDLCNTRYLLGVT